MDVEVDGEGRIARVRRIEADGVTVHLEFENATVISVTASQLWTFPVGSDVRIDDAGHVEPAPDGLWKASSDVWVGVVRLTDGELTVVDRGGRWECLPATQLNVAVGNTVKVEGGRIARILSEKPLRLVDLHDPAALVAEDFRVEPVGEPRTFEEMGGYVVVVERARELIETSLRAHDRLQKLGTKAIKGVLFTGGPGTGKTMLAQILASVSDAQFYEISGPRVFSKYVGDSEQLLRSIFEAAAQHPSGAIVFIDEIDSVASKRGDDSNEVSRRVVAQLLTLMDGFLQNAKVVVVAATNRPGDLDPALRRPGRFDWEINFPMPSQEDRIAILTARSRDMKTAGQLPFADVAAASNGWSPAELNAIWTESGLIAVRRGHDAIWSEDFLSGFERASARRRDRGASVDGERND